MGRVFVAGSINMDVVATADRHPRLGETVAGREVFYFPGGKGANQAVAAAKLGAATTLIGRVGTDAFGRDLRAFLAAQGIDLTFVQDTPEAHTGTAIITVANADNTIVVVPGANALVSAADVDLPPLAKGDVAVSQFEIPLPAISAFFKRARAAGATTILNPAPAPSHSTGELLDLVDILILNESELGLLAQDRTSRYRRSCALHRSGAIVAGRHGQDHLRHARQARRGRAGGWRAARHFRAAPSRRSTPPAPAIVLSAPSRHNLPTANPFAMRSITPTSQPRFACSAWARRRRCRPRRK